jgi:pyrroline-5-carboxylate reductase
MAKFMKYGFIGFGNLAQAIYQGLKKNSEIEFAFVDPISKREEPKSLGSIRELASYSDVIWLCVKPQNLPEVLEELKKENLVGKLLVSPVAGKSISFFEKSLGKNVAFMRIMPNLAVAYSKSVTAYCANDKNNNLAENIKENLLKLGHAIELPEEKFDLFTAIFGSGPAFLLEVLQSFKNKISELGISEEMQNELLEELVLGTIAYFSANQKEKNINEMIEKITSRGGTTEAGLKSFKENNLGKLLEEVIVSAEKKSQELGK